MSAKAKIRRSIVCGVEWAIKLSAAYGAIYLGCLATHALMVLCGVE